MPEGIVAQQLEQSLENAQQIIKDTIYTMLADTITFVIGETIKDKIERLIILLCIVIIYYFIKQIYNKIKDKLTNS